MDNKQTLEIPSVYCGLLLSRYHVCISNQKYFILISTYIDPIKCVCFRSLESKYQKTFTQISSFLSGPSASQLPNSSAVCEGQSINQIFGSLKIVVIFRVSTIHFKFFVTMKRKNLKVSLVLSRVM